MKRSSYMMFAVLFCGVLLTWGLAIGSKDSPDQGPNASSATLSMEKAIATAKAKFPGKVLEAEFEHEDGKAVYEIEIAGNTGEVMELKVDAQSGEVLSSEREDHNNYEQEKSEENRDN